MRPSLLHDPEIANEIAYKMALGIPQVVIANAYDLSEPVLSHWKKKKSFRKLLASKVLEQITPPIEAVRDKMPLAYIERHPETRAVWGRDQEQASGVTINLITKASGDVVDVELVSPRQIEGTTK